MNHIFLLQHFLLNYLRTLKSCLYALKNCLNISKIIIIYSKNNELLLIDLFIKKHICFVMQHICISRNLKRVKVFNELNVIIKFFILDVTVLVI